MTFISVDNISLYAIFYSFIFVRRTCTGCNILSLNILITAPIPRPDPLSGRTGEPPPSILTTDVGLHAIANESPCSGGMLADELEVIALEMLIASV